MFTCGIVRCIACRTMTLQVGPIKEGKDNTYGTHDHNRHKKEADPKEK